MAEVQTPRPKRRNGWHIVQKDNVTTMARHWPPRFDVAAQAAFPSLRPVRLARQVRQDLWRMLSSLRGFSPVVIVERTADGCIVRAGGRCSGPVPPQTRAKIDALLHSNRHRARWIDWAHEDQHDD